MLADCRFEAIAGILFLVPLTSPDSVNFSPSAPSSWHQASSYSAEPPFPPTNVKRRCKRKRGLIRGLVSTLEPLGLTSGVLFLPNAYFRISVCRESPQPRAPWRQNWTLLVGLADRGAAFKRTTSSPFSPFSHELFDVHSFSCS